MLTNQAVERAHPGYKHRRCRPLLESVGLRHGPAAAAAVQPQHL